MEPLEPFTCMKVYIEGSHAAVQPHGLRKGSGLVDTLSIDLDSGSSQVVPSQPQTGRSVDALGVMGLCKLQTGYALVVVTAAKQVATLKNEPVYEVAGCQVLTAPGAWSSRGNRQLLILLNDAVNPEGTGRGLHFSYSYDLTLTSQHAAAMEAADPQAFEMQLPVARADPRFFWNRAAAQPLLAANAHRFVVSCILGFVQQLKGLEFQEPRSQRTVKATLTLIARRSTARAGTRQWRRGADTQGNVANYVETEQLLSIDDKDGPLVGAAASYIITRGSIPLLWTQLPNLKYKPTTIIAPAEMNTPVHDSHIQAMVEQYKGVVAVNLVNQHKTEGKLEAAFREQSARFCTSNKPGSKAYRYLAFDFHAECSKQRYHNLSKLWDQVAEEFAAMGFHQWNTQTGKVMKNQNGVMRINCIDCLDRTNVVQGVFARKSLEAVLDTFGLMPASRYGSGPATLPEAYPRVESIFKVLWADHGDMVSTQYAGTGAMKSGFTRTGKRTTGGAIDDGVKAVTRYYLNNYQDGKKQDAIDFLTGSFTPADKLPLGPQPSPMLPMLLSLAAMAVGGYNLGQVLQQGPIAAAASAEAGQGGLLSALLLGGAALSGGSGAAAAAATGGMSSNAGAAFGGAAAGAAAAGSSSLWMQAAASPLVVDLTSASASAAVTLLLRHVALPLLLGLGMLMLVLRFGKHLVNKPQLCPQLAVTVSKDAVKHKQQ
uniref:SAC domain-containing protein n=1 Tax=Dunaliella tertiolecta TaxID=3047 RepID=A0A7S3QTW7_DUNTE|mmetsp:Transcript_5891/g.15670  ORF Transcript_5891/g.15670 Transcript_5891/m.15670 type:complete len:712 (+) Transcript_5891:194-2329(+)